MLGFGVYGVATMRRLSHFHWQGVMGAWALPTLGRKGGIWDENLRTPNAPLLLTHLYLAHKHEENCTRQSDNKARFPRCVVFEFTTSCHHGYRPEYQCYSQRVQNDPFVPHVLKIKQFQELWWSLQKRLITLHFWCIPPELRLSVRTLPSRRKYFGKVKNLTTKCKVRKSSFCGTSSIQMNPFLPWIW